MSMQMGIIVVHNTVLNSSDNLPFYPPDIHQFIIARISFTRWDWAQLTVNVLRNVIDKTH